MGPAKESPNDQLLQRSVCGFPLGDHVYRAPYRIHIGARETNPDDFEQIRIPIQKVVFGCLPSSTELPVSFLT